MSIRCRMIWKLRRSLNTKIARYLAFFLSITSVFVLTSFKYNMFQALGWSFGVVACLMWAYWGWQDRNQEGYGRFLMEITSVGLGIWGVVNWYG